MAACEHTLGENTDPNMMEVLNTYQKYARAFELPEEDIAHAHYDIFTGILTVTYGKDKPRYRQKTVTRRATKEFADFFMAPIYIGKGVDYILTAYLKAKGKNYMVSELMLREGGTPAGSPDANDIVNRIVQEIKEKPWTVPEKRAEIVARLRSAADEIDRKTITEIRSFRPLGVMSEFGAAMGGEPRKGVRIDTLMGATVFDEKRVPSKERVDRWDAEHKMAERIRGLEVEYAFALDARPNTVTGNYRVVEHAQRLKAQGFLTPEEEKVLNALEKYWQEHPELDRQKGYGVWGYNLEIMVPERLRKNMIEKKVSAWKRNYEQIEAFLRHSEVRTIEGAKAFKEGIKQLYPLLIDMPGKEANELRQQILEMDKIAMNTLEALRRQPVNFEKAAIKSTEAKQPWEMTKYEAIQEAAKPLGPQGVQWSELRRALATGRREAESHHKQIVKDALSHGKPVPPEVLVDYPDLATLKKQPWEMTYREFADFFEEVYGGQKFTFAERVGKPLGIQSQAGEPYHMVKGRRIGYSGSMSRDRWRLAIVDKALSEGKMVPEDVLAELSESLKKEKEKLGGTGMAEQEKPPSQEVKDWMRKALGIEDYKGVRSDRIGVLTRILYSGEIGNLRTRDEVLNMAIALGKDLGYGEPPAYGKSLERYYAEKVAEETEKEVPIIKGSVVVKPSAKGEEKETPPISAIFDIYTAGYSRLSLVAVTQLSDIKLAEDLTTAIPELSKEDALKIAPQIRALANAKAKEMEAKEVRAAPAPAIPAVDFWGMVKDLKITDVQVEFAPGEPSRGYRNIYLYTYAILENGKRVRMHEEIFKGRDVTEAQKLGAEYFRQRKLYMIGETVEKNVRESSFIFLNRYEEYVKQAPVAVQKRFEESGAIAGGTPARQILTVTEPEGYYFGTQVEVMQGADPELEPYFTGTVKRLLNNGELVEVHPEGQPAQVSFRVPVDRVNVTRLVAQQQATPDVQALFDRYKRSTVLPVSVLDSPEFMNDEAVAKDISQNLQISIEEALRLVPQFRAIVAKAIHKEEIERIKEHFGIDVMQESRKLGIDLMDYEIVPAGNRVFLQHRTQVQRQYELKSPAGYIKRRDQEWQEKYRKAAGRLSLTVKEPEDYYSGTEVTVSVGEPPNFLNGILKRLLDRGETVEVQIYGETNTIKVPIDKARVTKLVTKQPLPQVTPPAAPPAAKPAQSIQEIKQQVLNSIQAARSVEELQPILKGIGFLPLPEAEKQQLMDAYQKRYSTLLSEIPFGAPIKIEEKPRVIGAPTKQELFEAEQRRKAEEARKIRVQPTLIGGVVTAKRLEMFEPGAVEKARAEAEARKRIEQLGLPYEVHPVIKRLAASTQDVLRFGSKRGRATVEDLVLERYVKYCPPGTIINNMNMPKVTERWWVYPGKLRACITQVEQKLTEAGAGMVKEGTKYLHALLVAEINKMSSIDELNKLIPRIKVSDTLADWEKTDLIDRITYRKLEIQRKHPASRETSVVREATQYSQYTQGAQAIRDVIHYFRDRKPPIRGVLYRARDRTYFVEAQDGQIYSAMGWEDVSIPTPVMLSHHPYDAGKVK